MDFELFLSKYASPCVRAKYSCLLGKNYLGNDYQFFEDLEKHDGETSLIRYTLNRSYIKIHEVYDILQDFWKTPVQVIDYVASPPSFIIDGYVSYNGAKLRFKSGSNRLCVVFNGLVVMDCG